MIFSPSLLRCLILLEHNIGSVCKYTNLFTLISLLNSFLLRIQLFFLSGKIDSNTILWSVYCSHNNIVNSYPYAFKIYWPGDLFNAKEEHESLLFYNLIMPLTEDNLVYIKNIYPHKAFLSTTGCDTNIFSIKKISSEAITPECVYFTF